MQGKSDKKLYARLERLKTKRQWSWKAVAQALALSVPMLMMVKSGRRGMSANAQFRLEEAEKEAGIEPPENLEPPSTPPGFSTVLTEVAALMERGVPPDEVLERLRHKRRKSATYPRHKKKSNSIAPPQAVPGAVEVVVDIVRKEKK